MSDGDFIPLDRPWIGDEEVAAAVRVLRSGRLAAGAEARAFEEELARYVGAKHALALSSCTAALELALEATDVARGHRVIVPTLAFAATAEVVAHFGATPVLCDVEPESLGLSVGALAELLAENDAGRAVPGLRAAGPMHAVIPVHYAGQMADVDGIDALAQRHGLRVIEDAAQALPAWSRTPGGPWRSAGTTAEQTCFSVSTGEGGMLVTDDAQIAERARRRSRHGLSSDARGRRSRILAPGYEYGLTDLAAAIGRQQLARADALHRLRSAIAERYRALLGDLVEIELPSVRAGQRPSWQRYVMRLHLEKLGLGRDQLLDGLRERGVGAGVHWMPLHLHPYYREAHGYREGMFPVAEREWRRMVSLPIFAGMSEREVERVAAAVRDLVRRGASSYRAAS